MADKGLFAAFALVSILQINMTDPAIWGLFAVVIGLNFAVTTISDSVALVNIIQFGIDERNAPKVNLYALVLHTVITVIIPYILYLFKAPIAHLFGKPEDITLVLSYLPIFCLACLVRMYCLKFIYKYSMMERLFVTNLMYFLPITVITLLFKFYYKTDIGFSDFIYMYACGNIISSIVALLLTYNKITLGFRGNVRIKTMIEFDIPLMFTFFLHSIPKQLDSVIILFFFNKEINGVYNTAKTFFRVFEEAVYAAQGLIYPALIRRLNKLDITGVKELVAKSVSFLFVAFILIIIVVQSGVVDLIFVKFIDSKYHTAAQMFQLLSFAGLFLPFYIFSSLINAELKTKLFLKQVSISVTVYLSAMYIIGHIGNYYLIPIGYIIYTGILGMLGYFYYKKNYNYYYKELFRSLYDARSYFKRINENDI